MVVLFEREMSVITKHINNVFKEGELDEQSNVHFLHIAISDKPVKRRKPSFSMVRFLMLMFLSPN